MLDVLDEIAIDLPDIYFSSQFFWGPGHCPRQSAKLYEQFHCSFALSPDVKKKSTKTKGKQSKLRDLRVVKDPKAGIGRKGGQTASSVRDHAG